MGILNPFFNFMTRPANFYQAANFVMWIRAWMYFWDLDSDVQNIRAGISIIITSSSYESSWLYLRMWNWLVWYRVPRRFFSYHFQVRRKLAYDFRRMWLASYLMIREILIVTFVCNLLQKFLMISANDSVVYHRTLTRSRIWFNVLRVLLSYRSA